VKKAAGKLYKSGIATFVLVAVACVGVAAYHFTFASSSAVSSEAENGKLIGVADVGSDSSASGGKYVRFPASTVNDPVGYADSCKIVSGKTVIYGWAYDPNTTKAEDPVVSLNVGGYTVTANTDIAGYRDVPINASIENKHPGNPQTGTYGFKAEIGVLNKGAVYTVKGTVKNVGAGSNRSVTWNSSGKLDGAAVNSFADGRIPDACMSGAATAGNPYGYADYCTLESGNTIIHGWAYDPNAAATADPKVTISLSNGKKVTVSTSVADYRIGPIEHSIVSRNAGDPLPGSYGFEANLGKLYKGEDYTISGTITDVGAGADANLGINGTAVLDGVTRSVFAGKLIPTSCLGASGLPPITKACGDRTTPPAKYDHVIWIYEENREFNQVIGAASAPYMTSIAKMCGTSSNFHDFEPCSELSDVCTPFDYHSSIAYPAAIAGASCKYGNGVHGTGCWYTLKKAQKESLTWPSLFNQVRKNGGTWKEYDESAPKNCAGGENTKLYHPGHNPARLFSDIADQCASNSVAIPGITCTHGKDTCSTPTGKLASDIKNGTLPTFSLIIPNVANEMHGISGDDVITNAQWVNQGDMWFKTYMELLFNSAEYKKGKTAVFVIWDEPRSDGGKVPFLAISPSTTGGIKTNAINNFAVLRATEDMLGISKHLGCASGKPPAAPGSSPPAGSSCFTGASADIRSLFRM
jgi:hypothetical protein